MKDPPYVFWCTPCKKRHGGECPPQKKAGFIIELRKALVGSRWVQEDYHNGQWVSSGSGNVWEVVGHDDAYGAVIAVHVQAGNQIRIHDSGWESSEGLGWRMVPAP